MKNKIIDSIGMIDDDMIESVDALRQSKKERAKTTWTKWVAIAACLCLVVVGSINTLQRFDYLKGAGCSAMPGTIVDGSYFYKVDHSGVWRYSDGNLQTMTRCCILVFRGAKSKQHGRLFMREINRLIVKSSWTLE